MVPNIPVCTDTHESIIRYFEESGMDYAAWSDNFHMHFGYFKWGMNPFNREALLQRLTFEVARRLHLDKFTTPLVYDLGCGLGASSRLMAKKYDTASFRGFTITPWQVEHGNELSVTNNLDDKVTLEVADFCNMPVAKSSADGVFAIESSCYAPGSDKRMLIRSMAKVLKPGGRFVIADGFRKHSEPLPGWLEKIYRKNLECWALKDLGDIHKFKKCLEDYGFKNIVIEDASWKVAPSFLHIPAVTISFLWKHWKKEGNLRLSKERWNNILAPILGTLMGAARKHFSYYLISGTR